MRDRIEFIDALRGIAAVAVMLHHYNDRLYWTLFEHGNVGVPMFFVLSGFVIAMSIREPITLPYIGRFALRRAIRLDPPYWVSMFLVLAIGFFGASYGVHHAGIDVGQIAAHLVYLQPWLGYENIQGVYWTLCYEVQFYFVLLLMVAIGRRWLGWILVVTLALSMIDRRLEFTNPAFMGRFWFCFALGALTFYCSKRVIKQPAFFVVPMLAVTAFDIVMKDHYSLTAGLTALSIYAVITLDAKVGTSAPLQFLGRISYSLYLTHLIFGWLALRVAEAFVPVEVALIIGIAVAIVSAWVFYLFIERPSVGWSKVVELRAAPTLEADGKQPI